ncbi:non-heme ferritin [Candidatus Fukatsuia anoeciicola]|uniref:non-heme ferritin n=1 Tax=Candidatus Fukatsuia anoeciicola TaxID=2994492 RepID=UPI00346492B7
MLAKTMAEYLNEQLNLELYSANLYLQTSAYCRYKGFDGAAAFLKIHSQEEMKHMQRLFDYLSNTGALAFIGLIKEPPVKFNSLENVFKYTYAHEQEITEKINNLANIALNTKDFLTFNFLQWYIAEQNEEEKLFKSVVDKFTLVGDSGSSLFLVDKDLQSMASNLQHHTIE